MQLVHSSILLHIVYANTDSFASPQYCVLFITHIDDRNEVFVFVFPLTFITSCKLLLCSIFTHHTTVILLAYSSFLPFIGFMFLRYLQILSRPSIYTNHLLTSIWTCDYSHNLRSCTYLRIIIAINPLNFCKQISGWFWEVRYSLNKNNIPTI